MKKVVTFRLDPDLLERLRRTAQAENRTLTNFVETVLKRALDLSERTTRDKEPDRRSDARTN